MKSPARTYIIASASSGPNRLEVFLLVLEDRSPQIKNTKKCCQTKESRITGGKMSNERFRLASKLQSNAPKFS